MRRPRLGAAPGTPPPRRSGRWARLPAIHALRRSAGPLGLRMSVEAGRGSDPSPPVDRLSYTITMRSIIPACEALASTDDRPHDPAAAELGLYRLRRDAWQRSATAEPATQAPPAQAP